MTHSLHHPREKSKGQRPAGALVPGYHPGPGRETVDQLGFRGFWVLMGLKGALTPEQAAQYGSGVESLMGVGKKGSGMGAALVQGFGGTVWKPEYLSYGRLSAS